ncbi:MAG: hypothetical protein IT371_12135 [Deltaproteobacteria bacterium]|nr:hypothetical protein [Deltaproteobacteria bacterium]
MRMFRVSSCALALASLFLAGPAFAVPCGAIAKEGCCDGETMKWCSCGMLKTKDCNAAPNTPSCGWDGKWYACGTSGGADPAKLFPKSCGPASDAGPVKEAGVASTCPDAGVRDAGAGSCGAITSKGCCAGETVKFCNKGSVLTRDCNTSDAGPKCGWSGSKNYYTCGTPGSADPAGKNAMNCDVVTDGGVKADGAAPTRDGGVPTADSGVADDSGAGDDASTTDGGSTPTDGGAAAGDGSGTTKKKGCGCEVTDTRSGSGLALLVLALLAFRFRRARRA